MLGRCLSRHNKRLKHPYQSYCIAAQPSVFSLFGGSTQSTNTKINKNEEKNKEDKKIEIKNEANKNEDNREDKEIEIKNENNKEDKTIDMKNEANKTEIQSAANKIEEQNAANNTERKNETNVKRSSKKRQRQTTLLEVYSPLKQMEIQIQKMIEEVENAEQQDYLMKIQNLLSSLQKAEIEIVSYKSKKKQKLEEIEKLRQTLNDAITDKKKSEETIQNLEANIMELDQMENESNDRFVAEESLDCVEAAFKDVVREILKNSDNWYLDEESNLLICTTCEQNWEKTDMKLKPPCEINIGANLNQRISRHENEDIFFSNIYLVLKTSNLSHYYKF